MPFEPERNTNVARPSIILNSLVVSFVTSAGKLKVDQHERVAFFEV